MRDQICIGPPLYINIHNIKTGRIIMTAFAAPAINTLIALNMAFNAPAGAGGTPYVKNGEPVVEFTRPADTKIPDGCEKVETYVSKGEPVTRMTCSPGITP